jgi:cyclopropane fatty-acyl-phospholipid synthase-like methyltransferase
MIDSSARAAAAALPNPGLVMRLALAYRSSMALFAAADLDLFTPLANGPMSADDVSRACGTQLEPTRLLLEACAAEGLVTREGDLFRNTAVADAYLVKGRPAYIAHGLKFAEDLYPAWGSLATAVRSGRPTMAHDTVLGEDKEKTRAFVYAMHERARGISSVLPHTADFSGRKRLLDVGGGPGTYSIGLVRQTPGLTSTVLDLPGVLEVTREIVAEHGAADRIELKSGDYQTASFGSGYDAALLSGIMHRETPETCRLLLRKTFDAMVSGGMVVVSDVFFENDDRNSPPFATYFALNMMLMAEHGTTHAKTGMAAWMKEAGFAQVEVRDLPPPNPHSLVIGIKP